MTIKLLNPFSVSLEKYPFMEVRDTSIVYRKGDYCVYVYTNSAYVHTWKNIVIAERTGLNSQLIENMLTNVRPKDQADAYHDYERPTWAIAEGIKASKKLNFLIQ